MSPQGSSSPSPQASSPFEKPRTASVIADDLTGLDHVLARDIHRWRARGEHAPSPMARLVGKEGLHQQKIYRHLAAYPHLARRVEARVGDHIRLEMRANLGAARDLSSLVSPIKKVPRYRFAHPLAPHKLRKLYLEGQHRYGVSWYVLAAVNFVESKFGRILGPSSAGALGPMQFLPSTFDAYGSGDIKNPHDSILAAARYLRANGAAQRLRPALFAYNRAARYVDAVLRYARQMRSNDWSFWAYYEYQVFVQTKTGPVRLTGPGTHHPDHTPGRPAPT